VSMSVKGTILRADVSGKVMVKALLSGMPDCKFGMNDKVLMEKEPPKPGANSTTTVSTKGITIDDLKFHPCVVLPKFDKGSLIMTNRILIFNLHAKIVILFYFFLRKGYYIYSS